ncbi:MAG: hypothetical protein F6K65_13840 [Moorea sp. SIO3C2]|nr:hypothetical protein [Moorena sp. SIO3C2]
MKALSKTSTQGQRPLGQATGMAKLRERERIVAPSSAVSHRNQEFSQETKPWN